MSQTTTFADAPSKNVTTLSKAYRERITAVDTRDLLVRQIPEDFAPHVASSFIGIARRLDTQAFIFETPAEDTISVHSIPKDLVPQLL